MSVNLSAFAGAGAQFFDNNGIPLAGGKITSYAAGTTTPLSTYTSNSGLIANSNPIILDAAGRTPNEIWLTTGLSYKFVLETSTSVLIGTYDNIEGINATNSDFSNTTNPALGDALIGFRQANNSGNLTGAIGRTVHAKLQEIVDVKDFGAVADWNGSTGTDNTVAFQTAVDAIAGTGGVVRVTSGNAGSGYYFATQTGPKNPIIKIPSNVTILIDNSVYLYSQGGVASQVNAYYIDGTSVQAALFVNSTPLTGNVNIGIIGGNFVSVASGATSGSFIAFKNVVNVKVQNVGMYDINSATRMQLSYCKDVLIDNVTIAYLSASTAPYSFEDGIRIGSGCNNVDIVNCNIASGDDAIALNNELAETQTAITSTSGFPYAVTGASIQNVNISNCNIATRAGNAIRIYNEATMSTGVLGRFNINNITAYPANSGAGNNCISVEDFNSRHAVQYVNFDNMYISCINNSGGAGINLVYADFVTVSNTTLQTPATYGILSGNSFGTKVIGCNVFNTASVDSIGIFAGSTGSSCTNCNINGSARDGIHIETNDCVISNNNLGNITRNGIRLENSAQNTIVRDNRIVSTGAATIEAAGCDYSSIMGNNVLGGTTINYASAGANSIYEKNLGFNPVGSFAVGGTGSPQTLTATNVTTTFTISGGTVTSIFVGGVATGATGGSFCLPPNTSMVVGYTSGPTIVKTVH